MPRRIDAAVADVRPLGALAHHDEVDLARLGQRTRRAGEELRRAQVHVVVEFEPQLQQQAALDVGILQPRVAGDSPDRAEEDRVVLLDRVEIGIRERVAGLEESRRSEREVRLVESDAAARGRGIQHLLRLGDHLRPDAVTGDDGEFDDTGLLSARHRSSVAAARRCRPLA